MSTSADRNRRVLPTPWDIRSQINAEELSNWRYWEMYAVKDVPNWTPINSEGGPLR